VDHFFEKYLFGIMRMNLMTWAGVGYVEVLGDERTD
jgi:hypothetical protein